MIYRAYDSIASLKWLAVPMAVGLLAGCSAPDPAPSQQEPAAESYKASSSDKASSVDADRETTGFAEERGVSIAEAKRRLEWQSRAPKLVERARVDLGDQFGGVWIDVNDGDRVKVGVGAEIGAKALRPSGASKAAVVRRAAEAVGLTEGVDLVEVRHSMAELENANEWLAAQLAKVNAGAPSTLVAGLRTNLNAVELDLPADGALTAAQRELVDTAEARFGDMVVVGSHSGHVTTEACTYPNCDAPLRGGVKITSSGFGCTGGFIAQSRVDAKLYQVTAGHCGFFAPGTWTAFHANGSAQTVGAVHHWEWNSGGDMAIIDINDTASWNPQPWVNVTASSDTTANQSYTITATDWSVVGQRICATGAFLGSSSCGTVTDLGVTVTEQSDDGSVSVTVNNMARATYCGIPGDSGAPLYAKHTAFGIHTASGGSCDSYYQGIRQAEATLNVNVLLSP